MSTLLTSKSIRLGGQGYDMDDIEALWHPWQDRQYYSEPVQQQLLSRHPRYGALWTILSAHRRQTMLLAFPNYLLDSIDSVIKKTLDRPRGIRWTLTSQLEDLDYADDIGLLSHTCIHIQQKTKRLPDQQGLRSTSKRPSAYETKATVKAST